MQLTLIEYGSAAYTQMIALRMEILRRPLGLSFTPEQLAAERKDILIGAFENDLLIGCCVLTPHDPGVIQLRQMAVSGHVRSKGIGRAILAFAEQIARDKGYQLLMMHARNVAMDFYRKCGYKVKGEEFTEVTIPHHHMEKKLH